MGTFKLYRDCGMAAGRPDLSVSYIKALLIREVLYNILSQDVDSDDHPESDGCLLCQLKHVAYLAIWTESDYAVSSVRPLRPADWIKFQKYSCRVKKLEICSGINSESDSDIFVVFSFAPPSLFPNLHHLRVSNPSKGWPYFLRSFVGPRLIRLDMEVFIDTEEQFTFVSDLGREEHSFSLNKLSRDFICGWSRLQNLTCDALLNDTLTHLAHLESLQSLNITVDSPGVFRDLLPSSSEPIFTNLRDFTLHPVGSACLNSSISFLKHLPSALVALQIYPVENLNLGQHVLHDLLHVVDDMHRPHKIMERFSVVDDKEIFPRPAQGTAIDFEVLKTLLTFQNLREVNIDIVLPLEGLPKFRKLSLGALHECRGHSAVTLDGLATLLEFCPELEDLGIVVNAVGSGRPPNHGKYNNIVVLKLGDSNIASAPTHVAAFLSVIVPQVRAFRIWKPFDAFGPDFEEHNVRGNWWSTVMQ
ncbi:hypothetical protein SERLADRAFT_443840 [Serpula lacrymans var. lacrymans S7.9]|uniref:F-box domain-containing protein n=1 Tax=Serpula lacrymans var. lacrymans (strain S7.9) TaxID=578457 RepID=F8PDQ7_SERL9|nr:uncharacterized protein SERLADRAFT_443840 [Serpula lacrymans var. lacrymans S7.9]EGO18877.1 hypothetical protein SERLADRAFT_443840 [Serpula lacrymans var. lacrymans S7.9]